MGHISDATSGVLYRTSSLFNSKSFSDVEFHVRDAADSKVFYGHKLILSMAGEGFARWFYGKAPVPKAIKIADCTPSIFEAMLQYVYCDKINISSLEVAIDLIKIAKKFGIYELLHKCEAYVSRFPLKLDTVLAKYESAVSYQHHEDLPLCRRFVCQHTTDVFNSPDFCNASLLVIQDILKLDNLSVSKEMEVIEAAVRWAQAECKRINRPAEESICLRAAILPLFKHLRFLCLDVNEFLYFNEKYDILLNKECTMLTARILEKDKTSFVVPKEFSTICTPRGGANIAPANGDSQPQLSPRSLKTNNSVSKSSYSPPLSHRSEANVNASSFRQPIPRTIAAPVQPDYSPTTAIPRPSPSNANGQPLYQLVPPKKNAPVLKVIPQTKVKTYQNYEFPLHEMQKEIGSAFAYDLKCNATITMLRGTILIHGIELRVQEQKAHAKELVEVHLCLSNKSTNKSNSHAVQLKNSTLELSLDEPHRVSPGNPLDVEVTVEDLKLSRCSVCRSEESESELNHGLGVTAKFSLNSNQSNGNVGFFFLISKIIYSTL